MLPFSDPVSWLIPSTGIREVFSLFFEIFRARASCLVGLLQRGTLKQVEVPKHVFILASAQAKLNIKYKKWKGESCVFGKGVHLKLYLQLAKR